MISFWRYAIILALVSTQAFVVAQAQSENYPKSASSGVRIFKPIPLPEEPPPDHNADKVLNMGPLRQYSLPSLGSTTPIRLEATFNEALTLKDALETALKYSLPIKISRESLRYQEYQLAGEIAGFLPSFSTSWGITNTQVGPITTEANSRLFQASVRYPVFTGGNAFYTTLAQYYRTKAWRETQKGTVNDTLLDVYIKYTNLELNDALLQIKAKSLAISESQLKLNNALFQSGTGTQFAIMQSRAQLAADQQALLQQQMLTRQAAMALAFALDIPMTVNLIPHEGDVVENTIVDERLQIADLLNASLSHRPDIKQYELLRLAACRNMQVASASLYPTISFFTTFTHASTSVYPAGNSDQLNGVASGQVASAQNGTGTATNTALNQTASFSPTGNNSGTAGANTTATVVASSGGNPIASTQSGSLVTSGAVAPNFGVNTITGGTGSSNINGSNTASAGVFPGLSNTFQAGFSLSWSLPNMGQGNVANIMSARSLARQAMLQCNQELLSVGEQVRFAYCNKISSKEQIDSAASRARSAAEALRLANMRLQAGMGSNLELIQTQRDYVAALTAQAQAIIASNQAQAQLLHDTGLISIDTLTHGFKAEPMKLNR